MYLVDYTTNSTLERWCVKGEGHSGSKLAYMRQYEAITIEQIGTCMEVRELERDGEERTKSFFCHASEDAGVVDMVYRTVIAKFPEHKPWLDQYEITAGQSLLSKIADGIESADKFFIFLSDVTITKSWVQRELRKAIMREIDEADPDFIVPVIVGAVEHLPAFLEDKLYIDLRVLTQDQWLSAFDSVLCGHPTRPTGDPVPNLTIEYELENPAHPNQVLVWLTPKAWAVPLSFTVRSTVAIDSAAYMGYRSQSAGTVSWTRASGQSLQGRRQEVLQPNEYRFRWPGHSLNVGERVAIAVSLPVGADASSLSAAEWK